MIFVFSFNIFDGEIFVLVWYKIFIGLGNFVLVKYLEI